MRKSIVCRALLVGVVALSSMAAAVPANAATRVHVENPAFNTPGVELNGTYWRTVGVGGELRGWSVIHGDVDVYGRGFANAPNRTQALSLNGGSPGTVIQTLETTPGSQVVIRWKQSPDTWSGCSAATSQVYAATVNDADPRIFDPGAPTTQSRWREVGLTFTADSYNTTLEFASRNGSGACGPLITEVVAHENP